jgi:UDP-N-acetylmuramate-alanine ligase
VFVPRVENIANAMRYLLRDGDVLVTMGAGPIGSTAHQLPTQLEIPLVILEPR